MSAASRAVLLDELAAHGTPCGCVSHAKDGHKQEEQVPPEAAVALPGRSRVESYWPGFPHLDAHAMSRRPCLARRASTWLQLRPRCLEARPSATSMFAPLALLREESGVHRACGQAGLKSIEEDEALHFAEEGYTHGCRSAKERKLEPAKCLDVPGPLLGKWSSPTVVGVLFADFLWQVGLARELADVDEIVMNVVRVL